ncbi:MAG: hypothetical protein SH817_02750 [Leptospira sp.]|nr:hypothetical protein [Leptospira sp.]
MNPIKKIKLEKENLKQTIAKKEKVEINQRRRKVNIYRNYLKFYSRITKSNFGTFLSMFFRFLSFDIWILNYTLTNLFLVFALPTLYITVFSVPVLLKNRIVLFFILFFPLILFFESIRFLKFLYQQKRISFAIDTWKSLWEHPNISYFHWQNISVELKLIKNKDVVQDLCETFCLRVNQLFYNTEDKEIRIKWNYKDEKLSGSANGRILHLLWYKFIKPLNELNLFDQTIDQITFIKLNDLGEISSKQNDGSSD